MTSRIRPRSLRSPSGSNHAEALPFSAGGLHVTSRRPRRRIRGLSRPTSRASAARPARDIRTLGEPVMHAAARARRRGHPVRVVLGDGARAGASDRDDSARYMSAGAWSPRPPAGTTSDTPYNIDAMPASRRAYRDLSGSFLTSRPGSFLTSSEDRCGYSTVCEVCGVAAVAMDLELAMADRTSRNYAIELSRELAAVAPAYAAVTGEVARRTLIRRLGRALPRAFRRFGEGLAVHAATSPKSVIDARSRLAGSPSQTTIESLVCIVCRGSFEGSYDWRQPCPLCGGYLPAMGFVNPRASSRQLHVDPDSRMLRDLQEHLRCHGLSPASTAQLLPDGADGTQSARATRVRDRLRKHRTRSAA